MNITQQKNDDLTSIIVIDVAQADYEQKVNKTLSAQAKNADIKGFRKGKVPKALVKKMYGNAILADELNRIVNDEINQYLVSENIEILGQPIPVSDSIVEYDINKMGEFNFKYKIGHKPSVDVSYVENKPTYTQYEIEIADDMVDKEIEHAQSHFGEVANPTGKPEGMDAIQVTLKELDEDGNVKEGGYEHSTSFAYDQLKLKKDQTAVGKLEVGDSFAPFNVYRAFDKEKKAIAKQVLELDEETMNTVGTAFELRLDQINRVSKAELNQEFFDKVYGEGNVTSEEEMREKVKENVAQYLEQHTSAQLKNDMYKNLIENVEVNLPDEFLKEWLLLTRSNDAEKEVTEEDIHNEYGAFADNLKSSLLFNAIAEKGALKVEFEELKAAVRQNLINQFRQYGMPLEDNSEMLDGMIERFMQDEKQVRQTHDQIMDDKIFNYLKENAKVDSKVVSLDEFNSLNEQKNEEPK